MSAQVKGTSAQAGKLAATAAELQKLMARFTVAASAEEAEHQHGQLQAA